MKTQWMIAGVIALACSYGIDNAQGQQNSGTDQAEKTTSDDNGSRLEQITVTGSHIPRAQIESAAPITVVTSQDIKNNGFGTVDDILRSLVQNNGFTQPNQFTTGFTPGAQEVDLHGLGPNHTLVLLNGRRIADFPLPFNGQSNFTDISNIPVSMIDRIEILSGSASAIYGSDAISGVVNFILKRHADGTTIDYRVGGTQDGGGASQRLQLTTGGTWGGLESIFSLELNHQNPIFAYQRSYQDSNRDDPTLSDPNAAVASRTFLRINQDGAPVYIDPGQAVCAGLSHLDFGTERYAFRPNRGYYCGSDESIADGTTLNKRKDVTAYASLTYHLDEATRLYGDFQFGYSNTQFNSGPLFWNYSQFGGTFINATTSSFELWQRIFTPEEIGGLSANNSFDKNHTFSGNVGVAGTLGASNWEYDLGFSHSQYRTVDASRALLAAPADRFFLGEQTDTDPDSGYPIFAPDVNHFYTPLTESQYLSLTQMAVDHAHTRTDNASINLNTSELFNLPAGPVGFAAIAEYGTQAYEIEVDPFKLDGSYFGLTGTGGSGDRSHYAAGVEFRAPLLQSLALTAAGRYDKYSYSGNGNGKPTYNLGLEWRPFDSLLVRGSAGTGFRAPDLHYLYAGPSGFFTGATDYYLCRTQEPGVSFSECSLSGVPISGTRQGNTALNYETSTSYTYGFVWSPLQNLDFTADYYIIKLRNEVTDSSIDQILREEADCRIGATLSGTPVDINSPSCVNALSLVNRNGPGAPVNPNQLNSVNTNPINASVERTSGVDFAAHYRWDTDSYGRFDFGLQYGLVVTHTLQQFRGDPVLNELTNFSLFDIPRSKASGSVAWKYGDFTTTVFGERLGNLPKFDQSGRYGPSMSYNASLNYKINDDAQVAFIVNNVFNSHPHRDSTNSAYPYYDLFWFEPVGREYFLQFTYNFGGSRK